MVTFDEACTIFDRYQKLAGLGDYERSECIVVVDEKNFMDNPEREEEIHINSWPAGGATDEDLTDLSHEEAEKVIREFLEMSWSVDFDELEAGA